MAIKQKGRNTESVTVGKLLCELSTGWMNSNLLIAGHYKSEKINYYFPGSV
jgi:hypothetical protein